MSTTHEQIIAEALSAARIGLGIPRWSSIGAHTDHGHNTVTYSISGCNPEDGYAFVRGHGASFSAALIDFRRNLPPVGRALAAAKRGEAERLLAEAAQIEATVKQEADE